MTLFVSMFFNFSSDWSWIKNLNLVESKDHMYECEEVEIMVALRRFVLFFILFLSSVLWTYYVQIRFSNPLAPGTVVFDFPRPLIQFLNVIPIGALLMACATYFFVQLLMSPKNETFLFVFIGIAIVLFLMLTLSVFLSQGDVLQHYRSIHFSFFFWLQFTVLFALLRKKIAHIQQETWRWHAFWPDDRSLSRHMRWTYT